MAFLGSIAGPLRKFLAKYANEVCYPVSMKYRGIYKLHKKIPDEEQEGFRLNYYGELGLYSLEEAFKLWLKKYRK